MSKTLLILGGTSFFGLSITDYISRHDNFLKKKINRVIILSRKNKKKLLKPNSKYIVFDYIFKDFSELRNLPTCDYIIYLLRSNNYKTDTKNFKLFTKMVSKDKDKKKILYTSSGAIYSFKKNKSKYNYSKAKLTNEAELKKISSEKYKCIAARCFTFVGKYLPNNSNFIIKDIIQSVIQKKKILIKSKIKVTRSYMHADDLANILLKILIDNNKKFKIFDIGSLDGVDVADIAEKIAKKFKIKMISNIDRSSVLEDKYLPNKKNYPKKPILKYKNSLSAILKTIYDLKQNTY